MLKLRLKYVTISHQILVLLSTYRRSITGNNVTTSTTSSSTTETTLSYNVSASDKGWSLRGSCFCFCLIIMVTVLPPFHDVKKNKSDLYIDEWL